jgi:ABC-2 type transport system ATP-binding protein
MIELIDVTRNYGEKTAVDGLSLAIPQGELFAFLGPNGAGKTTTIKMLVGLLRPTAGEVRVAGVDVVAHPREANRRMAYVPDEPHLYDKLTGREFLEFIAEAYG